MTTTIEIGGLTFWNASKAPLDADGIRWIVKRLHGWRSGASPEVPHEPRGQHGEQVLDGRFGSRALSFEGLAVCTTREALWVATDKLPAAFDAVEAALALVVNEPTPKQAMVWRVGEIDDTQEGLTIAFEVPLLAPDPFKYSAAEVATALALNANASQTITPVTNLGTAPTKPRITVTGPANQPRFRNNADGAKTVEININVAAGQTLVVDFAVPSVRLDGVDRMDAVTGASRFWRLLPGVNNIVSFLGAAQGGAAQADHRYRHAWK